MLELNKCNDRDKKESSSVNQSIIPMFLLSPYSLGFAWEFIRKGNRMECNNNKGMEMNGMEWNVFK